MTREPDHAFRVRAILWLHSKMRVQPSVLPTHEIEDPQGRARLWAHALRSTRATDLLFLAGCLLVVGAFFTMIRGRPDVQGILGAITTLRWFALLGALVLAFVGIALRQRAREPILVELRLRVPHERPIEPAAVEALRRDAGAATAWMVSEIPYAPAALDAARLANVRCFSYREGRFVEPEHDPASASVTVAPASGASPTPA